jgi:hypothetical protein
MATSARRRTSDLRQFWTFGAAAQSMRIHDASGVTWGAGITIPTDVRPDYQAALHQTCREVFYAASTPDRSEHPFFRDINSEF